MAGVSRSGYYYWLKSKENRKLKDKNDLDIIKTIFDAKHQKAGWRTIQMILENDYGKIMNHKKIRRIKNEYGLNTQIRRKNPYKAIAKKTQEHSICPNTLNRKFNVSSPYSVYSTDITYLFYGNGQRAYLSSVKDLATKEIVAHYLSKHIDMDLVFNTLAKTIDSTPIQCLESLMLHSDQGFHYTHPIFRKKLKDLKITQSMSRKGNCLDNAPIESFFGHFKDELNYSDCATFEELEKQVNKYIYDYNNNRYQWNLKKMTPVQYREHLLVA
jgi:transposase InsO family protein